MRMFKRIVVFSALVMMLMVKTTTIHGNAEPISVEDEETSTLPPTIIETMDVSFEVSSTLEPTMEPTSEPTDEGSFINQLGGPTESPTDSPSTTNPTTDSPSTTNPTTKSPTKIPTTATPTTAKPTTRDQRPSHCSAIQVQRCAHNAARDIIFVVDASESVVREDFYETTLNAVRDIICAFDPAVPNQYGLILFGGTINSVIPLDKYTHHEWEDRIEQVRNDNNSCCSCCTPLAEAFDSARVMLDERRLNSYAIVYTLTDGIPVQNVGNKRFNFPVMTPADYVMEQVPRSAMALKNNDVRLIVIGVRTLNAGTTRSDKEDAGGAKCDYLRGILSRDFKRRGNQYCIGRANFANTVRCRRMDPNIFPIVSEPVDANSFCSVNVPDILKETVTSICLPPPTPSPTRATDSPTTLAPTRSPTLNPTTRSPTLRPTTSSPTAQPSRTPTLKPTLSPTLSPVPKFDSVDLHFIVDMSNSISEYSLNCDRLLPNSSPYVSVASKKSCFGLMLEFAERLALKITTLGRTQPMGWKDDYPANRANAGIRVSVTGFSCNRATPKVFTLSPEVGNHAAFQNNLIQAYSRFDLSGETCPSRAIDKVVRQVELSNLFIRPYRMMVFLSDGIITAANRPKTLTSSKGLKYFGIITYAIGISVPKSTGKGLTLQERILQREQLTIIAGGDSSKVLEVTGQDAFGSLSAMADTISDLINKEVVFSGSDAPYCGYSSPEFCLQKTQCQWAGKVCYDIFNPPPGIGGNNTVVKLNETNNVNSGSTRAPNTPLETTNSPVSDDNNEY